MQVKPDFDSGVDYQLFYYDILDNFVSSSDVLSEGYSAEAPVNGAYARMVIKPRDDEDGKIGFTEKIKYSNQISATVKKEQNFNERFVSFGGKILSLVNNVNDMVFVNYVRLDADTFTFGASSAYCCTSSTFLSVARNDVVKFTKPEKFSSVSLIVCVFEVSDLPSKDSHHIELFYTDGQRS